MQKMFFHRDLHHFAGGHLKVWDYFNHVGVSGLFEPVIRFTKRSIWTDANPWHQEKARLTDVWPPREDGPLFLGNMDWRFLPEHQRDNPGRLILNLVQALTCTKPDHPHYQTLQHPAVRICVSEQITAALTATGRTNGPVITIPAGVDGRELPATLPQAERDISVLIAAFKRPELGQAIAAELADMPGVKLLTEQLLRSDFLDHLRRAKVAVLLPKELEGFFLPPVEAMLLDTPVICLDAVGNRSFCIPGETCRMPAPDAAAIAQAVRETAAMEGSEREQLLHRARHTASRYTLDHERQTFITILRSVV